MTVLTIDEVIGKVHDLPSLPVVVTEMLNAIGKENVDVKTLADKVSRDQALTAKTLRLANSSFYGLQHKITTIQQAIAVIGFQSVRTLITAAAVTGSIAIDGKSSFNFPAFWRHSLATAVCARSLARHVHVDPEYAFMAGLLHDIGRLVLVTCFLEKYEKTLDCRNQSDCYLFEAEQSVLGVDHSMVGSALARHWKFPLVMEKAVASHHEPDALETGSLAAVVHVADAIAHALDLSEDPTDLVPPLSDAAWDNLGLPEARVMETLGETEIQFEEACQVLVGDTAG
ncbi:MAG TPA: HDOD domain-containing protein [Noviherbaspirillum sp.]|uniref:HDOD domain-containing protein n=1 Tax=Noviherbaspirillum sp. TaxID=1926288 RepID=UPI002D70EB3C|nr:HDOD domain-containing protein [Noviherbaspirillum sp.]HYD95913.1 HDOD domain-containing protein [Noviherbaspirillum sp.]